MSDFPKNPQPGAVYITEGITYLWDGLAWGIQDVANPVSYYNPESVPDPRLIDGADFPKNPNVGDQYTYDGDTWEWDGTAWFYISTLRHDWDDIDNKPDFDGLYVNQNGDVMTGPLELAGDAVAPLEPVTLQQLENYPSIIDNTNNIAARMRFRGEWAGVTSYDANDVVIDETDFLLIAVATTSNKPITSIDAAGVPTVHPDWTLLAGLGSGGSTVTVGDSFPTSPFVNSLHYLTRSPVGLYLYYDDGASTQWVNTDQAAFADLMDQYLPLTGGTVSGSITLTDGTLSMKAADAGVRYPPSLQWLREDDSFLGDIFVDDQRVGSVNSRVGMLFRLRDTGDGFGDQIPLALYRDTSDGDATIRFNVPSENGLTDTNGNDASFISTGDPASNINGYLIRADGGSSSLTAYVWSSTGGATIISRDVNAANTRFYRMPDGSQAVGSWPVDGVLRLNEGNALYQPKTSDVALKTNIAPMPDMLDTVMQLLPRTFEWKHDQTKLRPAGTMHGMIAQEVEQVLPDAVSGEDGFKGIDALTMIGVLVKAVQELAARVEELEAPNAPNEVGK